MTSTLFLEALYPRNTSFPLRGTYILNAFSKNNDVLTAKTLLKLHELYSNYLDERYFEKLYQSFNQDPCLLDKLHTISPIHCTEYSMDTQNKLMAIYDHFDFDNKVSTFADFRSAVADPELATKFKTCTEAVLHELPHMKGFKYITEHHENQKIVDYLQKRSNDYYQVKIPKYYAYDKAIDSIVSCPWPVTAENCLALDGVGSGIAGHIIECIGGNYNCSMEKALKVSLQKNLSDFLRRGGFSQMADEFDADFKKNGYLPQQVDDLKAFKYFNINVKKYLDGKYNDVKNIFNLPLIKWIEKTYEKTGNDVYQNAGEKIAAEIRPITLDRLELVKVDPVVSERALGELAGIVDREKYAAMCDELDQLRKKVNAIEQCEKRWLQPTGQHTKDKWEKTLDDIKEFCSRVGRLPSSRAGVPTEEYFARWIQHQKKIYHLKLGFYKKLFKRECWEEFINTTFKKYEVRYSDYEEEQPTKKRRRQSPGRVNSNFDQRERIRMHTLKDLFPAKSDKELALWLDNLVD